MRALAGWMIVCCAVGTLWALALAIQGVRLQAWPIVAANVGLGATCAGMGGYWIWRFHRAGARRADR